MGRLLTQSQFARKTGYTPARISQLVKIGVIPLRNGRIDASEATAAIEANVDRSRRIGAEVKTKPAQNSHLDLIPGGFNSEQKTGNGSSGFNSEFSEEMIEEYQVQKRFVTEIDGEKFIIPKKTIMRVYRQPGMERVEVAFFPPRES